MNTNVIAMGTHLLILCICHSVCKLKSECYAMMLIKLIAIKLLIELYVCLVLPSVSPFRKTRQYYFLLD